MADMCAGPCTCGEEEFTVSVAWYPNGLREDRDFCSHYCLESYVHAMTEAFEAVQDEENAVAQMLALADAAMAVLRKRSASHLN